MAKQYKRPRFLIKIRKRLGELILKPAFGYCAAQKTKYFGYKLHAVCGKNGIFHSFDFTPANVHDVNYLQDIKEISRIAF